MYNDIESAVIDNGFTSDYFKLKCGIILLRFVVSTYCRDIFKQSPKKPQHSRC